MQTNIRWIQRFMNFEQAFLRLQEAVLRHDLNELERNGLIQRFEFTLEMGWKTLKDFLEYQESSPKETIRLAQESGYIDYAQALIDGLELRNTLAHDYSGQKFLDSEITFRTDIYPAIEALYAFFVRESQIVDNEQLWS